MEVGGNRWLYFVYVLLCSTLYQYTTTDDVRYVHPQTYWTLVNYICLFNLLKKNMVQKNVYKKDSKRVLNL